MKKIEAIIKPFKLEDLKVALVEVGISGLTVEEVQGYGEAKKHSELYRGSEYQIDFVPHMRLEIIVADNEVTKVTDVIKEVNHTGKAGDGKIFVSSMVNVIRIRTGETGENAVG
ncbi:P-II family nitrogen regulator [Sulfurimonas marina]|uniref:P-II family nitrogen regulator n=1 Tax=Sulfurimonas marina TaxID=2590551 RepID=A0A7M1ATI6_9BACT|nr:P-II family nitrogen regulator [Sulfurimonas marina]QOP40706.1 P-II family nitrogen regulator [Sulfurimonas marina]